MEFNPDNTKQATEVIFSCKKNKPTHPQLTFNGSSVVEVKDQKHLGVTLASNLSFNKHVHEKLSKAKRIIGIIKHLSKYLPLKTLDQMYKTLVRSHLDYCDIIYHEPSKVNQPPLGVTLTATMEELERVQYLAALAVTGAWKGSSRTKLYEELGWESLSERRRSRRTLQIHKIGDNRAPSYIKEKLPLHHMTQSSVSQLCFYDYRCRTGRFTKSFFQMLLHFGKLFYWTFYKYAILQHSQNTSPLFFRPKKRSMFGIHDPAGIHFLF